MGNKNSLLIYKALGALLTAIALFWIKTGSSVNSILFVLLVAVGIFLLALPNKK
ncbi:MAG TPA: hypothetical protein VJH92_04710 [Candidatus Nanoarchaeia archaeon]|nr:hypothetical protein [Candidatus Nanoarchaeia archaeon]